MGVCRLYPRWFPDIPAWMKVMAVVWVIYMAASLIVFF